MDYPRCLPGKSKLQDAGQSTQPSAGDPLQHKLADAELEDQIWAFLPPTARSTWQNSPKRMVTSEAQVLTAPDCFHGSVTWKSILHCEGVAGISLADEHDVFRKRNKRRCMHGR